MSVENLALRTSDLITDRLVLRPWSAAEVAAAAAVTTTTATDRRTGRRASPPRAIA